MSVLHEIFVTAAAAVAALTFVCRDAAGVEASDGVLGRSLASGQAELRVDGCGVGAADLTRLSLLGQPFRQTLKFGPRCDLEGEMVFDSRPSHVDLRVRHLGSIVRITGYVTAIAGMGGDLPFGFAVNLADGHMTLEGHPGLAEFSGECDFGFSGILSIGRSGLGTCRVRAEKLGGQAIRLNRRLVFEAHRD